MSEYDAATTIAAFYRGYKVRSAHRRTAAEHVVDGARWGLARAKSKVLLPMLHVAERIEHAAGSLSETTKAAPAPVAWSPEEESAMLRNAQRTYMACDPTHSSQRHKGLPSAPRGQKAYHLYCSEYNVGASELVRELQASLNPHEERARDEAESSSCGEARESSSSSARAASRDRLSTTRTSRIRDRVLGGVCDQHTTTLLW